MTPAPHKEASQEVDRVATLWRVIGFLIAMIMAMTGYIASDKLGNMAINQRIDQMTITATEVKADVVRVESSTQLKFDSINQQLMDIKARQDEMYRLLTRTK